MVKTHAGVFFIGTTAERTATAPRNGSTWYDTDEDAFYDYYSPAWIPRGSDLDVGPNAALILEIVAGELELLVQDANEVFAGPLSGADDYPTFRLLVVDDLPIAALDDLYVNSFSYGNEGYDGVYGSFFTEKTAVNASPGQRYITNDSSLTVLVEDSTDSLRFNVIRAELNVSPTVPITDSDAIAGEFIVNIAGANYGNSDANNVNALLASVVLDTQNPLSPAIQNINVKTVIRGPSQTVEWRGINIETPLFDDEGGLYNLGQINVAYGLYVDQMNVAFEQNYAIVTASGIVQFNLVGDTNGRLIVSGSGDGGLYYSNANLLYVDCERNKIGILTDTPDYQLDMVGTLRVTVPDTTLATGSNGIIVQGDYESEGIFKYPAIVAVNDNLNPTFAVIGSRLRLYKNSNGAPDDHPTAYSRITFDFDGDGAVIMHESAGIYPPQPIVFKNVDPSVPVVIIFQTPGMEEAITNVFQCVDTNDKIGIAIANNAHDLVFNDEAGTKIGTSSSQKLAFYGASPVDRPAAVTDPTGGILIDAEARTAIIAVIDRLQELGLIA